MKTSKLAAATGLVILSAGILAACSFGGSNSSGKNYSYVYTADPDTLDYTVSNKRATNEIMANVVDGLLESDKYGNLVPSLAEDWTVSKDGLTYTYKLREGVKWYTSDGEEYADVTAKDFVTSLKHAADSKSDGLYIVQKSVKGLDDYVNGKITDFSQVGVKAVDDSTVQYTLNQPESFWNSKTTMGILFPVNEEFLKSKGDKFAQGTDPTSVLYNGPFILKSITSKSQISLEKNPNYWDKEKVKIDTVKFSYYDGQDTESLVRGFSDGNYTIARLFPNSSNFASVKKQYGDNIVYTPQGSGTFVVTTNIDRQSYEHTSKTTDAQKSSTKKALLNKDFRQALLFAFDRTAYSAQTNGEEAADKQLRNTFVPPTFVQANGREFGSIVEENLASYGDEWNGVKLDDAQDGLYNPEKAKAEFAKAKEALQAEGVEFPIHLDIPVSSADTNGVKSVQSLKQSIEANLGSDNVVIDIQQMTAPRQRHQRPPDDRQKTQRARQTARSHPQRPHQKNLPRAGRRQTAERQFPRQTAPVQIHRRTRRKNGARQRRRTIRAHHLPRAQPLFRRPPAPSRPLAPHPRASHPENRPHPPNPRPPPIAAMPHRRRRTLRRLPSQQTPPETRFETDVPPRRRAAPRPPADR